jgi:hypothetical protein
VTDVRIFLKIKAVRVGSDSAWVSSEVNDVSAFWAEDAFLVRAGSGNTWRAVRFSAHDFGFD